jgi:phage baseplate assembly protein W
MGVNEKSFLGTGWKFPPTFALATASVVMSDGERDIHESLDVLFSTWLGERIMVPQFGTDLWRRVFNVMTLTVETEVAASVRQSIVMWEPRIDVLDVIAEADPQVGGLVVVTVDYIIRKTNVRSNYVYPFYLEEGTLALPAS